MKLSKRLSLMLFVLINLTGSSLYSQDGKEAAQIPTKRWNPVCIVLNGQIYVIGGQSEI